VLLQRVEGARVVGVAGKGGLMSVETRRQGSLSRGSGTLRGAPGPSIDRQEAGLDRGSCSSIRLDALDPGRIGGRMGAAAQAIRGIGGRR
jgi:hypothetical protein